MPIVITKVLKIIREEACESITRDDLARRVGVASSHLATLLRERTGRTFTDWVRETRIERACELLGNLEMSVSAVACECGFCDQSYFTHVFQSLRKTTPKQYRDALLQKTQNNQL